MNNKNYVSIRKVSSYRLLLKRELSMANIRPGDWVKITVFYNKITIEKVENI